MRMDNFEIGYQHLTIEKKKEKRKRRQLHVTKIGYVMRRIRKFKEELLCIRIENTRNPTFGCSFRLSGVFEFFKNHISSSQASLQPMKDLLI